MPPFPHRVHSHRCPVHPAESASVHAPPYAVKSVWKSLKAARLTASSSCWCALFYDSPAQPLGALQLRSRSLYDARMPAHVGAAAQGTRHANLTKILSTVVLAVNQAYVKARAPRILLE